MCRDPPPPELTAEGLGLSTAEPEPWVAPRCVLVSGEDVFLLDRPALWLDSLHIQLASVLYGSVAVAVTAKNGSVLFMSNTAIQGDEDTNAYALWMYEARGAFVRGEVNMLPDLLLHVIPA